MQVFNVLQEPQLFGHIWLQSVRHAFHLTLSCLCCLTLYPSLFFSYLLDLLRCQLLIGHQHIIRRQLASVDHSLRERQGSDTTQHNSV